MWFALGVGNCSAAWKLLIFQQRNAGVLGYGLVIWVHGCRNSLWLRHHTKKVSESVLSFAALLAYLKSEQL